MGKLNILSLIDKINIINYLAKIHYFKGLRFLMNLLLQNYCLLLVQIVYHEFLKFDLLIYLNFIFY
jgi:hypothetical protein